MNTLSIVSLGWWFGAIGIAIAITMFMLFVWYISNICSAFGYDDDISNQVACIIIVVWIIAITLCLTLGGNSEEDAVIEMPTVKTINVKLGEPEPLEIDVSED